MGTLQKAGGGATVDWFDVKEGDLSKSSLKTDLGLRYAQEHRFQYYPTPASLPEDQRVLVLVAPRLGINFKYAITKDILFGQQAEVLVNLWGPSRQVVNTNTTLTARLTESVSLNTGFLVAYDSAPAAGKKPLDTTLQFGLGIGF